MTVQSSEFLDPETARRLYGLGERDSLFASELDAALLNDGVASIEMPIPNGDFEALIESYENCIHEYPELLASTYHSVDSRHGNEAGHTRKERKIDPKTGLQKQDPKNLIHFSEKATMTWREQFASAPRSFRELLALGADAHAALVKLAVKQFAELEETHPRISSAYFPGVTHVDRSLSFMRVISYDSYPAALSSGDVAKPHFDVGGATIQAYADAPGFWGSKDGVAGERVFHESDKGYAQFFMGVGHRKLYGKSARLQPLWHGVERIIPDGVDIVPKRHAVILFIDAPRVDYGVTEADTLPHLANIPRDDQEVAG